MKQTVSKRWRGGRGAQKGGRENLQGGARYLFCASLLLLLLLRLPLLLLLQLQLASPPLPSPPVSSSGTPVALVDIRRVINVRLRHAVHSE